MANPGMILLISFAIIITIAVIALLAWAAVENSNNPGTGGTGTALSPCSQNINISELIQIPTNESTNCAQQGATGTFYYIGNLGGGQYDYVVARWGTQPFDVCIDFCRGFSGGVCTGPDYAGQSAQANFDRCMSELSSTTCSPPIPIAAQGTFLYYAYAPTCSICDNCRNTINT